MLNYVEIYSPRKNRSASLVKNETRSEKEPKGELKNNYYNDRKLEGKSRSETLTEWMKRKFYEKLKDIFENEERS